MTCGWVGDDLGTWGWLENDLFRGQLEFSSGSLLWLCYVYEIIIYNLILDYFVWHMAQVLFYSGIWFLSSLLVLGHISSLFFLFLCWSLLLHLKRTLGHRLLGHYSSALRIWRSGKDRWMIEGKEKSERKGKIINMKLCNYTFY